MELTEETLSEKLKREKEEMTKLKLKLIERQKEMMQQQIQQVMTAKVQE